MVKKIIRVLVVLAACSLHYGCGADPLARLRQPQYLLELGSSSATFSGSPPDVLGNQMRYLFIIDKSGSNQTGNGGGAGTDPDGSRRFASLQRFIDEQRQKGDQTSQFAYVSFSSGVIRTQEFTPDKDLFSQLLVEQRPPNTADSGGTNFVVALTAAGTLISADIAKLKLEPEAVSATYVVFHISDGVPNPAQSDEQIKAPIDAMLAMARDENASVVNGVYVHSGFYFSNLNIPAAQEIMRKVALWGKGQALVFDGTKEINFASFKTPSVRIPIALVDVFMTNINTVWESVGVLRFDADGDGISDVREQELGSNPEKTDSDDNGVSDPVELHTIGTPCSDLQCDPARATNYYDVCASFLEEGASPVLPRFIDTDGDGLNDCEEFKVLKTNHLRFDTNGDWIVDSLAFRGGVAFLAGQRDELHDPDNDGLDNYSEVRRNTPIYVANSQITELPHYDYSLTTQTPADGEPVYSLDIRNVPTLGPKQKNHLRIYVLERAASGKDFRIMRVAEKALNEDGTVVLESGDFKGPYRFSCDRGC